MAKPGVMFYFSARPCMKRLSLEEKGQLFEAILDYGEFGTIPELEGAVGVAWDFLQPKLDADSAKYDETCLKRRYATFKREIKKHRISDVSFEDWCGMTEEQRDHMMSGDITRHPINNSQSSINNLNSQSTNSSCINNNPPQQITTVPPTLEEVCTYCNDNNFSFSPEKFFDYYQSKGWKFGREPIADWMAVARNWERNENENRTKNGNGQVGSGPVWTGGTVV